ncbi:hypothetical protein ACWDRR_36155 [Kitasatospora sp. NPDC003701]
MSWRRSAASKQSIVEALVGTCRILLRLVDTDGPAQTARAKAGGLTEETPDALEGLGEESTPGEVSRRLERKVPTWPRRRTTRTWTSTSPSSTRTTRPRRPDGPSRERGGTGRAGAAGD